MQRILAIMRRLRDPSTGCAWDRAQTFASIAPYTIEEAYEVADAIERGDLDDLRDELGDLLLQIVFHAQIAEERGAFSFADVAEGIADKMVARHPHVFGAQESVADDTNWEDIKRRERILKGETSAMDGVARALPAATRAQKLQQRAARTGFDWPDREGPAEKVREELEELRLASDDDVVEEAGDLLFAAVNVVRAYGQDAEAALRKASDKFERRFRAMEALANGRFNDLAPSEQERLWEEVKRREAASDQS